MQPGPRLLTPALDLPNVAKHPGSSFLMRTWGCSSHTLGTHLTQDTASMSAMAAAITSRSLWVKSASISYATRPLACNLETFSNLTNGMD